MPNSAVIATAAASSAARRATRELTHTHLPSHRAARAPRSDAAEACASVDVAAGQQPAFDDEAAFVRKFTAPYAPLIAQKLWCKDGPPPEGHQPATLSQARQRGWGGRAGARPC